MFKENKIQLATPFPTDFIITICYSLYRWLMLALDFTGEENPKKHPPSLLYFVIN